MKKSLTVINQADTECGGCKSSGCESCGPTGAKETPDPPMTRRQLARATFLGSAALLAACSPTKQSADRVEPAAAPAPQDVSRDLDVVQKSKGPVMTLVDEFFKMGPGPSSSYTMGPMRITYDFYQRVSKLPPDQLKRATSLKVHLYGSLSATGKGHGTDRAALAGLLGKAPATCPPAFLDGLAQRPDEVKRKVDLDTCIAAMAMTAKDMNPKYKETSEAGLAALVLC